MATHQTAQTSQFENISGTRFSASPTKDASRASPLMGAEDPLGPEERSQQSSLSLSSEVGGGALRPTADLLREVPSPPSRGKGPRRSPPADPRAPSPGTSPWGCFHPPKTSPGGAPRAGVEEAGGTTAVSDDDTTPVPVRACRRPSKRESSLSAASWSPRCMYRSTHFVFR